VKDGLPMAVNDRRKQYSHTLPPRAARYMKGQHHQAA